MSSAVKLRHRFLDSENPWKNLLAPLCAAVAITLAIVLAIGSMMIIKFLHDHVRARREDLIERYTEIAGRVTALFIGSFAIEMILTGAERWLDVFQS